MIRKLYYEIAKESESLKYAGKCVDREIDSLMAEWKEKMEMEEFEKLRDIVYHAAIRSEENGFTEGFKMAVRLMTECYKGTEQNEIIG